MFQFDFSSTAIISLLLSIPGVLLALSVHECAHGWMSYKLGDPTARNFGRLTINPIKHIDPIGFICMILFRFGWAKPVPVNARYYKKPRRDMALVAAAGPISNLIMCIIGIILVYVSFLTYRVLAENPYPFWYIWNIWSGAIKDIPTEFSAKIIYLFFTLFMNFSVLNASLAIFNLIPIPPLDGSRIAFIFLPVRFYFGVMKYERYIQLAMLVLLYLGAFDKILSFFVNGLMNGLITAIEWIPIFKFPLL